MENDKRLSTILSVNRRRALQLAGATAVAGLTPISLAKAAAIPIKIGYVSPQTGPLAGFGEVDNFILEGVRKVFANGITNGGTSHPVEIIVKDSQSSPNRAAEVAAELILKNGVDLMLVGSSPDNANPVSDQAELNGVPCISTTCPWQPWFFGRGAKPAKGFDWTYHYFWGVEDIVAVFTNIWNQVPTNKIVGMFLANDSDGNAWGDPKIGLPPAFTKMGYNVVDPGRFQPFQSDFSAQIAAFKKANVEIVCGPPTPPDFKNFWTQARQQGFKPKVVTIGKAIAFPSNLEAMGDIGVGLSQEVWWTPTSPFKSSLTGQTSQQLADSYQKTTSKEWNATLGYAHSLFEVAADVLKRTKDLSNKASIRDAILETNLDTTIGHVSWKPGPLVPVKNVTRTPLVGGQWVKSDKYPFDLVVVDNLTAPEIPVARKAVPIPY
jgi:branched-chain amino acid transport system substrate-binding protein